MFTERRKNVRSSIADLRVLYASQMQNLHTQIEGSSKFVPTTPGRHVILEMDGISALNPATFKVDHSVRFVLLDDAVLVARRRRRRNTAEADKLIAEKCWPLTEMIVLDTKDTACESTTPNLMSRRTYTGPDPQPCRTCSRSGQTRRHMSTGLMLPRIRSISSPSSDMWRKSWPRGAARNAKESINGGRAFGLLVVCGRFHDVLNSQR